MGVYALTPLIIYMALKADQYSLLLKYTAEASEFYRRKMMGLIEHDKHELRGYIPDGKDSIRSELPATLMYRIDTLKSADGHRLYEFLIRNIDTVPLQDIKLETAQSVAQTY